MRAAKFDKFEELDFPVLRLIWIATALALVHAVVVVVAVAVAAVAVAAVVVAAALAVVVAAVVAPIAAMQIHDKKSITRHADSTSKNMNSKMSNKSFAKRLDFQRCFAHAKQKHSNFQKLELV